MKSCYLVVTLHLFWPVHLLAQTWVVNVSPGQNQIHVDLDAELRITFNEDLDPGTVTDQTIKVIGSQTGFYGNSSLSYGSASKTVRFQPDRQFLSGETISISITTGIRNTSAQAMPAPFSWHITAKASASTAVLAVASTVSVTSVPYSIATGDLDGDGDLDFAVTKYSGNRVSLFLNGGGFTEATQINVGTRPHLVVQGDFDGDGSIDLAVANDGSNSVSILKNQVVTSVSPKDEVLPSDFALSQNYPNPFNPSTKIEYSFPEAGHTELVIYNLVGSAIRTLVQGLQTSGTKSIIWDGKNDEGETVPAGLYFINCGRAFFQKHVPCCC